MVVLVLAWGLQGLQPRPGAYEDDLVRVELLQMTQFALPEAEPGLEREQGVPSLQALLLSELRA